MPSKGKRTRGEPHPNERPEAPHPPEEKTEDEDFICDECQAVDWSSLPGLAANGSLRRDPHLSEPLRTVNVTAHQLSSSPCKVCRILSLIVPGDPDPPDLDDEPRHFLKAMPISMIVKGYHIYKKHDLEGTVLSVYCCGDRKSPGHQKCVLRRRYLAVMKTRGDKYSLTARRILPSSVNFDELHALINCCKKEHDVCNRGSSSDNLPGLRVIDITTRAVIQAPARCTYLALSYVWGGGEDDHSANDLIAPPPVIEDAIQFANFMKYKYLWVDRYVSSCGWFFLFNP